MCSQVRVPSEPYRSARSAAAQPTNGTLLEAGSAIAAPAPEASLSFV